MLSVVYQAYRWFCQVRPCPSEYEPEELTKLFPQAAIQQATKTITQIAEITEDKSMYDAERKPCETDNGR